MECLFLYCKLVIDFFRVEKIVDSLGVATPEGFEEINILDLIRTDLDEENISRGGEVAYNWASHPGESLDLILDV